LPEIAVKQARHEDRVLHPERPFEAELVVNGGNVRFAGAGLDDQRPPDRQSRGQRKIVRDNTSSERSE
jgi:hypothetical protein